MQRTGRLSLLSLTVVGFALIAYLPTAVAQGGGPDFDTGITRLNHFSNPPVNRSVARPANRATKLSPEEEKRQTIEQAIDQGNKARESNDYERALLSYEKVVEQLNPKDARAFYGIGNIYVDLSCTDSAIEAYLNALKLKRDYPEALISLGYSYVAKERYDDAEEQFQAALKAKPVFANIGLAYVYANKGQYEEAIHRLNLLLDDKSIDAQSRASCYFALAVVREQQKRWMDASAQYERAINENRTLLRTLESDKIIQEDKVIALKHTLGIIYFSLARVQMIYAQTIQAAHRKSDQIRENDADAFRAAIKQAIDNLDRAKENGFNHPNLYISRGRALVFQLDYREAVDNYNIYFDKVRELEAKLPPLAKKCAAGFTILNANGHWWLGDAYYLEGTSLSDTHKRTELYDRAIEQFKEAIALKQDFDVAYGMLGQIYDRQGKSQEAIGEYQNAIRFNKDISLKAQNYRSMGLAYATLKNYDEAVRNVREAIRLDPNRPAFYESLASIAIAQGDIQATFDSLKKATELSAKLNLDSEADSDPYYFLGTTYAVRFMQKGDEGDFNQAVQWLKKAIAINPRDATYYQALGVSYEKHNNADKAIEAYEKAILYDPKNPEYHFDVARIYAAQHNYDAAIERTSKVIEIAPKSAQVYQYLGAMHHRKGNDTEAVKAELKAIELDEKYMQAYIDLAEIYRNQKNYTEASKYLDGAVRAAPTDFHPYKERAKLFEAMGQAESSIQEYERAISFLGPAQIFPKELYRCRIERLRGKYTEAITCLQKLQGTPSDADTIIYDLGATHVASKNKSAATAAYEQLKQMKSDLAADLWNMIHDMK